VYQFEAPERRGTLPLRERRPSGAIGGGRSAQARDDAPNASATAGRLVSRYPDLVTPDGVTRDPGRESKSGLVPTHCCQAGSGPHRRRRRRWTFTFDPCFARWRLA
jgi:hypothetical protein